MSCIVSGRRLWYRAWPMDDLSKLVPIPCGGGTALAASPHRSSRMTGDRVRRPPEAPWRLAVVEAWFARARQAGLDTIEERRRARLARAHERPGPASKE